jgi:elongation factor P
MTTANQLNPGMTIIVNGKLYRVESSVKVTVPKGNAFIKAKLRDLESAQLLEKNFKPNQEIEECVLQERRLEFLYAEKKQYLFLDIGSLDQVSISAEVIGAKVNFLKEGVEIKAALYGQMIFSVELPQFLELMVVASESGRSGSSTTSKIAQLETGAQIPVPPSIEVGDLIKVDVWQEEFVQRVY